MAAMSRPLFAESAVGSVSLSASCRCRSMGPEYPQARDGHGCLWTESSAVVVAGLAVQDACGVADESSRSTAGSGHRDAVPAGGQCGGGKSQTAGVAPDGVVFADSGETRHRK